MYMCYIWEKLRSVSPTFFPPIYLHQNRTHMNWKYKKVLCLLWYSKAVSKKLAKLTSGSIFKKLPFKVSFFTVLEREREERIVNLWSHRSAFSFIINKENSRRCFCSRKKRLREMCENELKKTIQRQIKREKRKQKTRWIWTVKMFVKI